MRFKIRSLIILALVCLAIAGAFFLGILDWGRIKPTIAQSTKNIASNIGGGDLLDAPGRVTGSSKEDAEKCRANLRKIETAKRAVATKTGVNVGTASWDAVINEMGRKPKCPSGGSYQLGNYQVLARCTVGASGTSERADDHLIDNF